MSITYDEILKNMEETFYRESGKYVKDYSDISLRFRAVASEIYAAYANADYVLKQAFVQTAQGEYLDRHAALRGITRKKEAKATGTLVFFMEEPLDRDVEIPANTVCSIKGRPLIQYATNEKTVIPAGSLSAGSLATALSTGDAFNVSAGTVNVMVNPPEHVSFVTNINHFIGGYDDETDSALRERILASYGNLSNAVNRKSAEELIMTVEDIIDAALALDEENGRLNVCLRTKNNKIMPEVMNAVKDILGFAKVCSVNLFLQLAERAEFSVIAAVKVKNGADEQLLKDKVTQTITNFCEGARIGKQLETSRIAASVAALDDVEFAEISADPSFEGTITCGSEEYLILKDVQVELYE